MKKYLKLVSLSLALISVLALFVGCNSYSKIEKAFTKAEWEISKTLENLQTDINSALPEEYRDKVAIHAFKKGLAVPAIIFEFKDTKQMEEVAKESETIKGLISDAQKTDHVNGNCVLIMGGKDAIEIFKNA